MKHRIRMLVVSLLAIALLAWFLRHANLGDVWRQIRHVEVMPVVVAIVLLGLQMAIRAERWRDLLEPVGMAHFRNTFRTTVIGFAASNVLPARAGEVLRPYLLARREGFSAAATFATIVMERVMDLIAVLTLLAAFVLGRGLGVYPDAMQRVVLVSALVAGGASLFLLVMAWTLASHPERIGHFVLRAGRLLPHRIAHGLSRLARTFSEGLLVMRRPRVLAIAMAWSFVLWISIAVQTWLIANAFDIALPFTGSFLLQSLLVIGIALPTPGGVGGYHEAFRLGATTFFGAANDAAIGAAIVSHAIAFIPTTIVGVWFAARDGLSLSKLDRLTDTAAREELPVTP